MSDLIDRQAAIERIVSIRPSTPKQSDYSHGVDVGMAMAMVAIKEQPSAQLEPLIKDGIVISRNLCDSCINNGCIFQKGIIRNHCDFYKGKPTIDAVEVVRCKDCKHYIDHNCYERNHINIGLFVHDNNYCGWAERRQDE